MGVVWEAHDPKLDRRVAIKTIRPEFAKNRRCRELFLQEGRATAKSQDSNVVAVYQAEIEGDLLYLVMEFVNGCSLGKLVSIAKPMTRRDATLAVRDAAKGPAAAHLLKLVHRDIKPANLMRSVGGLTKVADFGLARVAAAEAGPVQGSAAGTPCHMAPEVWQLRHGGAVPDGRSDVYALTCTYYCLLAGEPPFTG